MAGLVGVQKLFSEDPYDNLPRVPFAPHQVDITVCSVLLASQPNLIDAPRQMCAYVAGCPNTCVRLGGRS
jgi:hypothetical protein